MDLTPILARSRSARRTRAGKAELSGRNARIPLILLKVDHQRLLEQAMADYIPALATVDPDAFGMAMATFDGEIYGVGQVERPFSIQSVSKLFTLALLLAEIGDRVWQGVGREPSGNPNVPGPRETLGMTTEASTGCGWGRPAAWFSSNRAGGRYGSTPFASIPARSRPPCPPL